MPLLNQGFWGSFCLSFFMQIKEKQTALFRAVHWSQRNTHWSRVKYIVKQTTGLLPTRHSSSHITPGIAPSTIFNKQSLFFTGIMWKSLTSVSAFHSSPAGAWTYTEPKSKDECNGSNTLTRRLPGQQGLEKQPKSQVGSCLCWKVRKKGKQQTALTETTLLSASWKQANLSQTMCYSTSTNLN